MIVAVRCRCDGRARHGAPFVIGMAGSVAVGKSTAARALRALLVHARDRPTVDLVATDGWLLPNRVLTAEGLMMRKGWPESYDVRSLVAWLAELKAGRPQLRAPIYSHVLYDIGPATQVVRNPDVVIVEGLNVLQANTAAVSRRWVSDFFDFSLYVDAATEDVARWYVERFLSFRATAWRDPASFWHHYSRLSDAQAEATATSVWREVNQPNLIRNILPTRERADLILRKGPDHSMTAIALRLSGSCS